MSTSTSPFRLFVCPHCDDVVEILCDTPERETVICDHCGTRCDPWDESPSVEADRREARRLLTSSYMREG